jgi:hypothetical protein
VVPARRLVAALFLECTPPSESILTYKMLDIPIAIMLKWPKPNWQNATTRSNVELYFASSFFLIVSVACVLMRLYSRIFVRRYFGLDDVFIVLAFVRYFFYGATKYNL